MKLQDFQKTKDPMRKRNYVSLHTRERNTKKIMVHADTFKDCGVEIYTDKKKIGVLRSEVFKRTMLLAMDMYSYVKDYMKYTMWKGKYRSTNNTK